MIEYGELTDIEDDFITVWADMILYNEKKRFMPNLIKLAERGQVNAISCWYMLKDKEETNPIIEAYVKPLLNQTRLTYCELVLLSHYYLSQEGGMKEVNRRAKLVNFYIDKMKMNIDDVVGEQYKRMYEGAEADLMNLGFMSNGYKAMNVLKNMTGFKYDPLMRERYIEISQFTPLEDYAINIEKKPLRRQLVKLYKSDTQNVQVKWSLAKNLAVYGDNAKQVNMGKKLLTELASRELKIDAEKENTNESCSQFLYASWSRE